MSEDVENMLLADVRSLEATVACLFRERNEARAERDALKAQLENVLDAANEGAWMARALDAEHNVKIAQASHDDPLALAVMLANAARLDDTDRATLADMMHRAVGSPRIPPTTP